jgi:Lrp/AsnC family transcriptional regulator, leucine-responsive regulatory protein
LSNKIASVDQVDRSILTGVIGGYRALIDPAAVGRSLRVFVAVRLMRHARADVAAFEHAVIQLHEVIYSHHITGSYDYLLRSHSPPTPRDRPGRHHT